jgi:hypothetical protein
MSDPERLRGSGSADTEVRELLESLRGISPDAGLADRSWAGIATKLAALPTVVPAIVSAPTTAAASAGSASAGGASAGISKALTLTLLAAAVASPVLGVFAYRASTAEQPPRVASAAVAAVARAPASITPPAPASPAVPTTKAEVEPKLAPAPSSAQSRASRLDAEASLLARVRSQLRSGDARGALVSLNQLQAGFPKGQLGQERDVLAVEVLAANGNTAAARRKAQAFIAAHPESPHKSKLQRFAAAP